MDPDTSHSATKQVRSIALRLSHHPEHVSDAEGFALLCARLRRDQPDRLLVADLFSGAGGLSYGLEAAGMRVVFGADHYSEANATHAHHFAGLSVDWDLSEVGVVEEVAALLRESRIDVLAGGPPCQPFSKAGRSGIRHRVREGLRDPIDARRDLWRSYLEVVRLSMPRAVIMENVPDMALDREMFILRSMALDLEHLGYSVSTRIVQTSDYGVPQHRQRLILVALRHNLEFVWPEPVERPVTLRQAISDLPSVQGGWHIAENRAGFQTYSGAIDPFQREMRARVPRTHAGRIYDHVTRPVREDDLVAFDLMDNTTRYSDLPAELRRYRSDIFDDKYKRLDYDSVSRTITAHIAKDGYWYIHPEQNRTITVREAARIQTFPDHFRFAGTPTAAFKQIGNAVPPRLGEAIGGAVAAAIRSSHPAGLSREDTAALLDAWWRTTVRVSMPWLKGATRWQVVVGELLLERSSQLVREALWPVVRDWREPADTLSAKDALILVANWINRQSAAEQLIRIAESLILADAESVSLVALDQAVLDGALPSGVGDLATLAGDSAITDDDELPVIVNQAILRVASRYANDLSRAKNKNSDGRLAVARLIGFGRPSRNAHVALLEIGRSICSTKDPECSVCPLVRTCAYAALHSLATD
ncbi:DNA (cytosine-5)-methyltransferase 1 [Sanguibacter gelidistatuariae]|uniref:Cytosine-specific methyltransferase n=1 Tax=Sanguibacter gelidistatuariae TaxID=1814289 RepID=A0A1G6GUD8_9MICO|nr:DNA cytosine methyltransferase [Sanguibacter gelidistatuariae]SDB85617.1 DNA (cytosine-5)-methyltransferase 1 [Sanguibacter gelidistatuariae]